ncbi:hypothetical protein KGQ31_02825 [Patescibacteria group bacterium]|nr:hypothetical protein [Patescibacteria group bacterium]
MTLTSHAIVGAAIASFIPTAPVLGVGAAFASHFVIDAIPHCDYPIRSDSVNPSIGAPMKFDRAFWLDGLTMGGDAVLGVAASLILFATNANFWLILLAACAGILPDPLQFVYAHLPREPIISLQRFHMWIHTKHRMKNHKTLGIVSQIIFIAIVIIAAKVI